TFLGISDSANVALGIFVFHILTLLVLVLLATAALIHDPSMLLANIQAPVSEWSTLRPAAIPLLLFFGFSAAMLGISGFESSANYLEEQQPGVFPKTLRNMWIAVAFFNPLISLLSLGVFSLAEIGQYKETLLSEMGHHSVMRLTGAAPDGFAAQLISYWISVDAVMVLSGAVLTSYVGVTGLIRRMSMDNCLPHFLLQTNRWRGTTHWIIGAFFVLCCSILMVSHGQIEMLAGVYTLSFLSVMGLFAAGNLMLKHRHPKLRRDSVASVPSIIVALIAIIAAIVGNVLLNPDYVQVFAIYFASAVAVVAFILYRTTMLKWLLRRLSPCFSLPPFNRLRIRGRIVSLLHDLECRSLILIVTKSSRTEITRVAEYVRKNESFRFLKVAWFYESEDAVSADIAEFHFSLDHHFPDIHIDLLLVKT
ncbi:MAG: amino acid transporter, partial [Planctomycetaceae bacterium]